LKPYKAVVIILAILIADQALKIWVKTHMILDDEIIITNWFRIHFAENRGMAFSMELPGVWGKTILGVFRTVATIGGTWFVVHLFKTKAHWGFITACCIILAGAIGNLVDGAVYGLIFSDSYGRIATFLPKGGGYAGFMQGQVVDMLRFPLYRGFFPKWLPVWGGEYFEFFNAVFNISDAAITVGVAIILIFQKPFFKEELKVETSPEPEVYP
jgi:signal peptidase II